MNFDTPPDNEIVIEEENIPHSSSLPALSHNLSQCQIKDNDTTNSSQCQIKDNDTTDSDDIPDMSTVLAKFGIDATKLLPVPLDKYESQKFDFKNAIVYSHDNGNEFEAPNTISQRIKSMTRRARVVSKYKSSHSLGD